MYSSRELIDVLLARRRRGLSLRERTAETPPGEFPPGWRAWFASMRERVGAVTGATAEAIVAIFLQREPAMPARASADLGRWQAFTALWRQQWHATGREPAHERVIAYTVTLLVHLVLAVLMLWALYVRFMGAPAPAGEDVIQIEYIGEGTPEETGGGAPEAETVVEAPEPPAEAAPAAAAPTAAAPTPTPTEPAPQPPAEPQPQPPVETPAPQPLQVTETPTPDSDFVLPPTTPPELERVVPQVRTPTVRTIERDIELVEIPKPPTIRPQLVEQPVTPVEVQPRRTVERREVPLLTRPQQVPQVARQPLPAPSLQAPTREVRSREIPLVSSGTGQTAQQPQPDGRATATSTAPRTGTSSPSATPAPASGRPSDASGERPPATAAGRGANPTAPPGAWPTPQRGDDWGQSARNRPGGNAGADSGLFDAQGRPKLPPGAAAPGGGFPPGSDDWTREQLDHHGTWATRPPLGYEPTRFDQYWIPSGTLLEEWVRRGVKNLSIPIPGTTKKISCVISILQLGGGCGITDPNLQDQEAIARPPPDVPFKPELQENQDALRSGKP